MIEKIAYRLLKETSPRILWKFAYNFGWKSMCSVNAFQRRLKRGEFFPAFMVISLTNRCNLSCQGCWVSPTDPPRELSLEQVNNVINCCKAKCSYFFGLLGGEPLLYKGLLDIIAAHPDCYFQVFTNGLLLTDEMAQAMRRLGNVTPLISVEGLEQVSDIRRGGKEVYKRAVGGVEASTRAGLVTGVAASICKSNFKELVSRDFAEDLIRRGVHYLWYYIYRPVGPRPTPELALDKEQIIELRRFIVNLRCEVPLIIVDAYWDKDGKALCPGAIGLSHHINSAGDIEFCPPLQFSKDNIGNGVNLAAVIANSSFLAAFRKMAADTTRGCIIMEHPELMKQFLEQQQAADSSGRGSGYEELSAMRPVPCHHLPDSEIPEKHWAYRFAKKYWFFGFGAYG